jgi:ankyrin repeat protein
MGFTLISGTKESSRFDSFHGDTRGCGSIARQWRETIVEAVECLLQVGANATARNALTGATPLHMCVSSHKGTFANKLKVVDLLLQHDNGIHNLATLTDQYGRLPIDYLLTTTTQNNDDDNGGTMSPEQEAYIAAMTEKLKPVDPPLLVAIDRASVETVQELLDLAGDNAMELVNVSFRNETPVSKTVQLLVTTAASEEQEQAASDDDDDSIKTMRQLAAILKLLLQAGGNPNVAGGVSSPGETADPPLVQVLQALVEAYREQGKAEESVAKSSTISIPLLQEAAVQLRQAGAVLTPNNYVTEFLHASARGSAGGLPMLQFLLQDLQLDPNATNRQGMTPLQFAARSGRVEIVQYLLLGSHNNDDTKESANASSSSFVAAVNVFHQDNAGQSALDAARKNNKEQVVNILEKYMQAHPPRQGDGDPKQVAPSYAHPWW